MKRLVLLLLVICLCAGTVFAKTEPSLLVDGAALLSGGEEAKLEKKLETIRKDWDITVAVYTAERLYDYDADYFNGYDTDYILLLISMDTRDWEVLTGGKGDEILSDSRLEDMADEFVPLLSDEDYGEAFMVFAERCDEAIDIYYNGEPFAFWPCLLGSLVAGLIIALIATGVMCSKLKSVKSQRAAANYVRPGSMQLTQSADLFLYSHVSRVKKPENNGSSGSRSFSGSFHGGRGGKF